MFRFDRASHRSSVVALCLAATLSALQAAQAPTDRVEVTGSRLRQTGNEPATPVQVVTREEILRSGNATLREWLDSLPSAGGGSSDIGGSASFAAGSSGASLRNMGKQSTLVLLNGRRLSPYPLADYAEVFTNVDSLPFEAIERVEILKIGGAAVYGSDAVAGVVNIITRPSFEGWQARASHQRSLTSGSFGNSIASVTGGFKGLPGLEGARVLANLELYRRQGVVWSDVLSSVRPQASELSPGFGTYSSYSWPGNVIGGGPVVGCEASLVRNGLCTYNRYQRFELIPAGRRLNGLLSAVLPLSQGFDAFSELLLSRTENHYISVQQPYGLRLPSVTWGNPSSNGGQTFTYRGLPANHPLNSTGRDEAELRYRFVDGPAQTDVKTTQYRALGGVRGPVTLAGRSLDAEVALGAMGGRTQMDQRAWFSLSGFKQVIGDFTPGQTDPLFFQRGYLIGQSNSAAVIDTLFPRYGYRGHVQQLFVDGRLSGNLARLPAGDVALVLGADLRHESFTVDPSERLRSGDIVGNGLSASDAKRWVGAAFAEANLPLLRGLEGQVAARLDKHGNTQAHLSPKLALRWAPGQPWVLRAAVEGGFRAPNLTESAPSTKFSFDSGVADPARCPQASALARDLRNSANALPANDPQRTLLQARADNVINSECGAALASIVSHNPALKPETSRSASLGAVFIPSAQWRLALDAWAIERTNEIGLKSSRALLAAEAVQPAGTINRAVLDASDRSFGAAEAAQYGVHVGALVSTVDRFSNELRTRNQGVDIAASGQLLSPLGPVNLKLDATYQSDYRLWSSVRNGWGDNLAGRAGYPRWKLSHAVGLAWGPVTHTLSGTTTSGTALRGDFYDTTYTAEGCAANGYSEAECRVAGYTRWDYALEYKPLKGVKLQAQVYNVFNLRTPFGVASWLNNGGILPPTIDDAIGRKLRLGLEVAW